MKDLLQNIGASYTAFHATARVCEILEKNGFSRLKDEVKIGGKYYVTKNDSSVIAFSVGEKKFFNIVAAHTDSPALKLKDNPETVSEGCGRLNVETYGGLLLGTWTDRKLRIAGRAFYVENGKVVSKLVSSPYNVVIPNLAIHMQRSVKNEINAQIDMQPLTGLGKGDVKKLVGDAISYDLFLSCAEEGYEWGENGEFVSSPRLDDLEGVFGGLAAFTAAKPLGVNVLCCFDNEEIGSGTKQGAASTFLADVLATVARGLKWSEAERSAAMDGSFIVSLDNAHASHPNHPELSDPTNRTLLGGGIAIKHHANCNYTTDGYSTALMKNLFNGAGVKYQDFYMRSDLRCGGTLGAISSSQVSIDSVDIGLPQLAMHSAVECAAKSDYEDLKKALTAFYTVFEK